MNEGRVKNFDVLKGFGFITRTKGKDLFFHWSDVDSKYQGAAVAVGTLVQFEVDETKLNRARKVKVVG
jgi:CspA family cold shock protein